MSTQRPPELGTRTCPDCGEEMSFNGIQPAGYAQFFCDRCRYRRDTYVGSDIDA